jgi:Helix-turn-helix domain
MIQTITPDSVNEVERAIRKAIRHRRSPPPLEARDWLTPNETALTLGCSVATVHRLRRGLISGLEALPHSQYERKIVFRKVSVARWRERNEKGGLAA